MTGGPIDEYLAALARRVGRFSPRRRRLLAEAEDHLREAAALRRDAGAGERDAEAAAVAEFGPPRVPAAAVTGSRDLVLGAFVAAALAVAATIAVVTTAHGRGPGPMMPTNQPLPASLAAVPSEVHSIPAGTRIDAYVRLSTGHTFVYAAFVSGGWRCEADYVAPGAALAPAHDLGAASWCARAGAPRRPIELSLDAATGDPLVLSGSVLQRADVLVVTTPAGSVHRFPLRHIPLHSDAARQAVIIELSAAHISHVARLALQRHGHTIAATTTLGG
jgi:hypothetical protein